MNPSHPSSPRRPPLPAWRLLLATGAALLAFATAAPAATYYVDNPGGGAGTVASPYSIAQVNANAGNFVGGDKILFKRGVTFPTTGLVIPNSGASGNPIIYGSYSGAGIYPGTGALPIIPAVSPAVSIKLYSRNHITIENLDLRSGSRGLDALNIHNIVVRGVKTSNTGGAGMFFKQGGFITIDNCEVSGMGNGAIYFMGSVVEPLHDGTISNCYVHDATAGSKSNGILLHDDYPYDGTVGLGENFLIQNNTATNCNEQGIAVTTGGFIVMEGNTTSGNKQGSISISHSAYDVIVRYHTSVGDFRANQVRGPNITIEYSTFVSAPTDTGNKPLLMTSGRAKDFPTDLHTDNLTIRNNVFVCNNPTYSSMFAVLSAENDYYDALTSLHRLTIRNNIYTALPGQAAPTIQWYGPVTPNYDANFRISNNVYYSPAGVITYTAGGQNYTTLDAYQAAYGREQNSKNTNPLLVNPASGDFRLSSTASSAFDAGTSTLVNNEPAMLTLDFTKPTKVATPQGAARDIGACEFPVAGTVPAAPSTLTATKDGTNPTSQINLSWENVANETGYSVERKTGSGGSYAEVTTTATDIVTLEDGSLSSGTPYYYRVRSYNANGYSPGYSPEASATTDAGAGPFQMSGNQVVMEAEHATSRTAGTPTVRNWTDITESDASGGASNNAVQALPNSGGSSGAPGTAVCRADYQINVPAGSAANFYVHLRGRAVGPTDDSVYVSIDGSTATFLSAFPPVATTLGTWVSGLNPGTGVVSTLAIPSGTHTVTLWMREDGAIIDKIVVSSSSTLPTGTGPAESSQGGTNSVPVITTTTLPGTIANESYSQTLAATGGDGALVWTVASGLLPTGLSLSSAGVISGSATTAGTANFTVKVADSDGVTGATDEDTQALSIVVTANSVPVITTTTLPAGTENVPYSQTLVATGGNGALVWSLASGTLPAGLTLSPAGVLSGTPTTATTASFTVKAADSDGVTGAADEDTQALSLVINASTTTITVSATDASASESGLATGTFTFTRSSSVGALTVNFTVTTGGANATSGTDYTSIGTTVVFADGVASMPKTVTPIQDTVVEGAETVIVTLAAGTGYIIGSPSAATVTIADNDYLFEAENPALVPTGSSGDGISTYPEAGASGGSNSLLTSNAAGDFITYTVNVAVAGTYNITVAPAKYSNEARCYLYVNGSGTALGAEMNFYNASGFSYTPLMNQGNVALNAGNNTLRFQVSVKGDGNGWKLSVDYIKVTQ